MCLHVTYVFSDGYRPITDGGFPHSEIPGSKRAYRSPRLIAVRCVLHRLLAPRHPPCALTNLTTVLWIKDPITFKTCLVCLHIQFSRNNKRGFDAPAWRRPTLPAPFGASTIGAGGLNGRVRNGNECVPSAIITRQRIYDFLRECTLKTEQRSHESQPI